ncbi:MAG: hypothetical protein ACRC5C_10875, partial [Bacilli bacterium]
DELSDIDLMVCTSEKDEVERTQNFVYQTLSNFSPIYIKVKQLGENIFLIIAILENKLEFNISIVPRELLSVRSPLWKLIFDKTGLVSEKMNSENERFLNKSVKYEMANFDVVFEFTYSALGLDKELKRNNLIYALKLLDNMRDYTLIIQATNENKKLHQFKAYETLHPAFIEAYLATYPEKITIENVSSSARKLKELFGYALKQSSTFSMDNDLERLFNISLA